MNKKILTLAICALPFLAYQAPTGEKVFRITLTEQEANTLAYIIEKSEAEHVAVSAIQKTIFQQIQSQAVEMAKTDSLNTQKTSTKKKP